MVGLTQLNSQQKNVLLEFATALQNRFNQFPEHIRLYTLGENDALTDLAPFASLKGLKIEDRVLSQKGTFWGKRLFDDSRGMRWGLNVAIGIEKFKNQRVGEKHVGIHELVHLIHDYCMSVDEKQVIESLYANAKAESRFLDSYSSINSKEYFAEAVETFFAVSRNHLLVDKFYWGQTADILKEKDPALFRFISSLFDESD